jgi:hypothetical protein
MIIESIEDLELSLNACQIHPEHIVIVIDNDIFHVYENDHEIYKGSPDFGEAMAVLFPDVEIRNA